MNEDIIEIIDDIDSVSPQTRLCNWLITDSKYVLTGEFGEGSIDTCLYSGQKNFVELYKRALSNEIKLLAIQEEKRK